MDIFDISNKQKTLWVNSLHNFKISSNALIQPSYFFHYFLFSAARYKYYTQDIQVVNIMNSFCHPTSISIYHWILKIYSQRMN